MNKQLPVLSLAMIFLSTAAHCDASEPVERWAAMNEKWKSLDESTPTNKYWKVWKIVKDGCVAENFDAKEWLRWEHRYDGKLVNDEDVSKAIETMASSLGQQTFMPPDPHFGETNCYIPSICGVSWHKRNRFSKLTVTAVLANSSAYRSGIRAPCTIEQINGTSLFGLNRDQARDLLLGARDSKALLRVEDSSGTRVVELTRDRSPYYGPDLLSTRLRGNLGYVHLTGLGASTSYLVKEVAQLKDTRGLVLDLRGGNAAAIEASNICGLFLNDVLPLFSTVDSEGVKRVHYSSGEAVYDHPIVILIDGSTWGLSELVAEALRHHGRAKLVGEKTAGLVSTFCSIFALNTIEGCGARFPTERYLTTAGPILQGCGTEPDVEVSVSASDLTAGTGHWWNPKGDVIYESFPKQLQDKQLLLACHLLEEEIRANAEAR